MTITQAEAITEDDLLFELVEDLSVTAVGEPLNCNVCGTFAPQPDPPQELNS